MDSLNNGKEELPFVARRKLISAGGSVLIALPAEWLKQKDLKKGDSVILVANGNLQIFKDNPDVVRNIKSSLSELNRSVSDDNLIVAEGNTKR
ncbi:hypothetical protein J4207_00415 [Candidatus Woesearchaeota archaeon]|nr:hypothetical protein [Candidatus Woesearchaeota archaeon]